MINDLRTDLPTFKFVDDSTVFEICKSFESGLQTAATHINEWSNRNFMKLNAAKTKEMVICFRRKFPSINDIVIDDCAIERVTSTKLLGVIFSSDLSWNEHVFEICKKAAMRIYQLHALKRAGVKYKDLILIYTSSIRPILEYACPVWHPGLTNVLNTHIENVQKRVLRIITPSMSYQEALVTSKLPTLEERRSKITQTFFQNMQNPSHKLHYMLPKPQTKTYYTRSASKYPLPKCYTERYKNSFVPFCLFNYQ